MLLHTDVQTCPSCGHIVADDFVFRVQCRVCGISVTPDRLVPGRRECRTCYDRRKAREARAMRARAGHVVLPISHPDALRFWDKVARDGAFHCWRWIGGTRGGSGQFFLQGKVRVASHVAWMLSNGLNWPPGSQAVTMCGTTGCVNPAHIRPSALVDGVISVLVPAPVTATARDGHDGHDGHDGAQIDVVLDEAAF